jgi:hypothetical protein
MPIIINDRWELTTDHSQSRYNQPVLVNIATRQAYGPWDTIFYRSGQNANMRILARALVGWEREAYETDPDALAMITKFESIPDSGGRAAL